MAMNSIIVEYESKKPTRDLAAFLNPADPSSSLIMKVVIEKPRMKRY
eukprot:CAMPEP_0170549170 /NCGR_PEP_ID=MMETSP0211-20121228/7369_1 /TAXON_ID=311385 /ORGANISM="Pseudokeronopsis sp., Strain OXSARD2" /LENGTH=46 /DNA_ID= /DNA_START= /DNA_END= /DNA_ORIENTATION=